MEIEKLIRRGDVVSPKATGADGPIFERAKVIGIIAGPRSVRASMSATNESTDILRVAVCGSPFLGSQTNEFSPVFRILAGEVEKSLAAQEYR